MVIQHRIGSSAKACLLAAATMLLTAILVAASASAARATTYANFNRASYGYSSKLTIAQEAARYQVMLLQSTDAAKVPKLKAANPKLKIFVYEGIMAAQNSSPAYVTCTSGPWVLANHPSWILKDQNAKPILYQNHYLMDVGNTAYQHTCLANLIPMVKKDGFDGVYWDMVNSKLSWTLPSGSSVPQYPTDASWQAAMYSMLSYAGSQLHANGLMNVANIGGAFLFPGLWQQWNAPLDGAEEEGFTDNKGGTVAMLWAWPTQLAEIGWSEANHKLMILHSWNTTQTGNRYGLASMLLAAGGEASYSTSNGCYTTCETWYPEYATAQQLGAPVGSYTKLSNGVYERWYQKGLVLVNASASSVSSFSLGGGTYTGSGLTSVSSLSMAPTTGYILLADPPVNTGVPTISGNALQGQTLTATAGTWSATPTSAYSYQWKRCTTTSLTSCRPISGATATTYAISSTDAGYYLDVAVTASNSAGSSSGSSAETALVPKQSPPPTNPKTTHPTKTTVNFQRSLLVVRPLSRRKPLLAATCPPQVSSRCTFHVTVYAAFGALPGSTRSWKGKLLGNGSLVLRAGRTGRIKIRWGALGRRALKLGGSLRVRIRIRVLYDGRLVTFIVMTRTSPPRRHR